MAFRASLLFALAIVGCGDQRTGVLLTLRGNVTVDRVSLTISGYGTPIDRDVALAPGGVALPGSVLIYLVDQNATVGVDVVATRNGVEVAHGSASGIAIFTHQISNATLDLDVQPPPDGGTDQNSGDGGSDLNQFDGSESANDLATVDENGCPAPDGGFASTKLALMEVHNPAIAFVNPQGLAVGDLNGDTFPDVVMTNSPANKISVLLGTMLGPGSQWTNFASASAPGPVAIGDVDGDGHPDVVTGNAADVSVLLGDGKGALGSPKSVALADTVLSLALADINGDHKLDAVVALNQGKALQVLLGDGTGSLVSGPRMAGFAPQFVFAGDLNADGHPDVVTASDDSGGTVRVFLNSGNALTSSPMAYGGVGAAPRTIVSGDLNGDQRPDLAIATTGANSVAILLAVNSSGLFQVHSPAPVSANALAPPVDFNADGVLDLAAFDQGSFLVRVLLGDGHGTFLEATSFHTDGIVPNGVGAADFNRDCKPDVVALHHNDNSAQFYLNLSH